MKFLTVCKIAVLATFFVIAEGVWAAPGPTYFDPDEYGNYDTPNYDRPLAQLRQSGEVDPNWHVYRSNYLWGQWLIMMSKPECMDALILPEILDHDDETVKRIVDGVNEALHMSFVYSSDGISDTWCNNLKEAIEALRTGGTWTGDCDNMAMTAYAALRMWGVDPDRMMIHTVLTAEAGWKNGHYSPYHPKFKHVDHMILSVDTGEYRSVIDNRNPWVQNFDEIMGLYLRYREYTPYTVMKPHHLSAYWAFEWYGDDQGRIE